MDNIKSEGYVPMFCIIASLQKQVEKNPKINVPL